MSIEFILIRIAQISIVVPIVIGLTTYTKFDSKARIFFYFLLFSVFTEAIAIFLSWLLGNNMPFMYVYTATEFGVFCTVFFSKLKLLKEHLRGTYLFFAIVMLVLLITDIVVNSIWKLNTISKVSECVLIVFIGLSYLLQYLQSDDSTKITKDYLFWIASGATLYFSVSFFFFSMFNILISENLNLAKVTSNSHSIASILANLLYACSFWVIKRSR